MTTDISRTTYRPGAGYAGVRLQQGRLLLDADFNEAGDIALAADRAALALLLGASAGPDGGLGFGLTGGPGTLTIGAGTLVVDGIIVTNPTAVPFTAQPFLPGAALPGPGRHIAYLEVFDDVVTALDDPALREVALGGPDTCTRLRPIWQVKLLAAPNATCSAPGTAWDALAAGSTIRLRARARPSAVPVDPCIPPEGGGYTRLENQTYRVEIHEPARPNRPATFLWSRDNGSVVHAVRGIDGAVITLAAPPRDPYQGLKPGDWIELTDATRRLAGRPGTLVKVTASDGETVTIDRETARPRNAADNAGAPPELGAFDRIRRWDDPAGPRPVATPAENDGFVALEDGIEVRFEAGSARTGDHWVFPARTITASIEWPADPAPANPALPELAVAPAPRRALARLAIVEQTTAGWQVVEDCRLAFPRLADMLQLFYAGGDGQSFAAATAGTAGQLQPMLAGVSLGGRPVPGARVRFTVVQGQGVLQAALATTGANGIAACSYLPDPQTPTQIVEAALLARDGSATRHLPIRYTFTRATGGGAATPAVLRIVRILIEPSGRALENDGPVKAAELNRGLVVEFDDAVEPSCFGGVVPGARGRPKPVAWIELLLPTAGEGGNIPFFTQVVLPLSGQAQGERAILRFAERSAAWLLDTQAGLPLLIQRSGVGEVAARLVLLGRGIWSARGNAPRHLDGMTFGRTVQDRTDMPLPSGGGGPGSDLALWFRLGP